MKSNFVMSCDARYGIDQSLLERVLRFNRIPAISQAADGRLFGSWHFKS